MCGIVGLVYADRARPAEAEIVTAMRDLVSYRGPDAAGVYLDGPAGLGHRRLSIIDLGVGARSILVRTGWGAEQEQKRRSGQQVEAVCDNLMHAVFVILGHGQH